MKCPNCQHTTRDTAILQCSECGEAFERNLLEEYQHLEYLTGWLSDRPDISLQQSKQWTDLVKKKQDEILAQLLPKTVEIEKLPEAKPESVSEEVLAIPPAPVVPTPEPLRGEELIAVA